MDARVIGERSDAVLRTAMPGHDTCAWGEVIISILEPNATTSSANISRTGLKSTSATNLSQRAYHSPTERLSSSATGSRFIAILLDQTLDQTHLSLTRAHRRCYVAAMQKI